MADARSICHIVPWRRSTRNAKLVSLHGLLRWAQRLHDAINNFFSIVFISIVTQFLPRPVIDMASFIELDAVSGDWKVSSETCAADEAKYMSLLKGAKVDSTHRHVLRN